ncbi:hypothetical protein PACILC2_18670 [Paenibacillus cisolokensis]|uniref:Uncharacterized protein n=1 Tax=Paenibacillus cisolokensis TaxID=1658519 RepID=A0ABQ4N551_9BACL|nr:hypothetical protein PACILC2_18670 [Paenibacillus cisolokensis]
MKRKKKKLFFGAVFVILLFLTAVQEIGPGREFAASESIEEGRGHSLQKIHINYLLFLYDMVYIIISWLND